METKDKLHEMDEIRLEEIFLIVEFVRGCYIPEIEDGLNKIEDAISDLLKKYGSKDE